MESCVNGAYATTGAGAVSNAFTAPSAGVLTATREKAFLDCDGRGSQDFACDASDAALEASRDDAAILAGVLRVSAMPKRFRPVVEEAMADCITSESTYVVPGDDPLFAQWCTRWYKDVPADNLVTLSRGWGQRGGRKSSADDVPAGIGCHQALTGTREELQALDKRLRDLAEHHGFCARVDFA